jgi:hypothetical protein
VTPDRTAAAIEARRRATRRTLRQVIDAITLLRRHKTPVTYPAAPEYRAHSSTTTPTPAR